MSDFAKRGVVQVPRKLDDTVSDMKEEEPLTTTPENIRHLLSKPMRVTVQPKKILVDAKEDEEEDDDDSEYVPTFTEEEIAAAKEAEAEAEMDKYEEMESDTESSDNQAIQNDADDDTEDDGMTEDMFKRYLGDAIKDVQALGHRVGQAMIEKVVKEVEEEVGEEVDPEVVEEAFQTAKDAVLLDQLEDQAADEVYLRKELDEALEIVKVKARLDAEELVEVMHENFKEATGRYPDMEEVRGVFHRLKETFAQAQQKEAEDELEARIGALRGEPAKDELDEDQREAMLELARRFVTKSMATSARKYFVDSVEREPTPLEFDELLIAVGTARFVNATFFGDSSIVKFDDEMADSDYDPMAPEEVAQMERDRQEDVDEGIETGDDDELFTVEQKIERLVIQSEEVNGPRPVAVAKPVAFYSPIASKKSKKRISTPDETVVNQQLLAKAVERFTMRNGREPTEEEVAALESFFTQQDRYVQAATIDFSA